MVYLIFLILVVTWCAGFSEIMGTLSRIGLFNDEAHSLLTDEQRPTFRKFLFELLKVVSADLDGPLIGENDIMERILAQGHCKDRKTARKTAKTIMYTIYPSLVLSFRKLLS